MQTYDQRLQAVLAEVDGGVQRGPFRASWDSLSGYRAPEWYRDAKFGIAVYWGPYAVPAFGSEMYPRDMYLESSPVFQHHIASFGPQIKFGYKDFIPRFTAASFDPDAWARLFRDAGARYVVPVAEHHDGFSLYNNTLTEWNSVNMGAKKDLISLVAGAVRRHGMVFGASSHRAEHWWFFEGGMQFDSDVKEPSNAGLYGPPYPRKTGYGDESQPTTAFLNDWLGRTALLIAQYRPQILWLDDWAEQPVFEPYRQKLAAYFYNSAAGWGRKAVLNHRLGAYPEKAAVQDVEGGRPDAIRPHPWQASVSLSPNSSGYLQDAEYRSADSLVDMLVDVVSKNGNLLVSVGPKADGTIPDQAANVLREVGRWLAANGEAVYGTRSWKTYGEGPSPAAPVEAAGLPPAAFTAEDIRFTVKGGVLYAIALDWPAANRLVIKSLGEGSPHGVSTIRDVTLLGSGVTLKWSRTPEGLVIELPPSRPSGHAFCFKIQIG